MALSRVLKADPDTTTFCVPTAFPCGHSGIRILPCVLTGRFYWLYMTDKSQSKGKLVLNLLTKPSSKGILKLVLILSN